MKNIRVLHRCRLLFMFESVDAGRPARLPFYKLTFGSGELKHRYVLQYNTHAFNSMCTAAAAETRTMSIYLPIHLNPIRGHLRRVPGN